MKFKVPNLKNLLKYTPALCNKNDSCEEAKDFGNIIYVFNPQKEVFKNEKYLRSIWTGSNLQFSVQSLKGGKETPESFASDSDIFIKILFGSALISAGAKKENMKENSLNTNEAIIIPSGMFYNIKNSASSPLKFYILSAKPINKHSTVID